MSIEQQYQKLVDEVEMLDNTFIELVKTNKSVARNYKGCQILMSRLFSQPKFLIIGINPGGKELKRKLTPSKENEYRYGFPLAKETRAALELAGIENDDVKEWLEANVIKTNHHYISTTNVNNLHTLYGNIKWSEVNPHHKANDWTNRLIEMISPEVILCEGYTAFKGVHEALTGDKFKGKEKQDVFKTEINGYPVICYKRYTSRIRDKQALANMLSPLIHPEFEVV